VVCLSSEKKAESRVERVFVMEDAANKLDMLLKRNASEQLDAVDWDELNAAISGRLDRTAGEGLNKHRFLKVASGLAAAAVIVFAVLVFFTGSQSDLVLEDGMVAKVVFSPRKGKALVEMQQEISRANVAVVIDSGRRGSALVDLVTGSKAVAKCDVEIKDVKGRKRPEERASWIIISQPEPVYVDNGDVTNEMSMLYLF